MEAQLNLPPGLITDAKSGRIMLFLGAGASVGARDPQGRGPLLGNELRDLLVSEYLTPDLATRSLAFVAELAISERSLPEVQDFVASRFKELEPAEFHLALTTFKWRAIVTTNYDRVVEKAYDHSEKSAQEPIPILSNEDRVDEKLRGDSTVALLKLHGCVTITHREDLPLILTVDQYGTHRDNREDVFDRFEGWAREYPVVFIGHSLEDPDRLTGRRIFLHWDDAASNVADLCRLISYAKQKEVPITVISAERINEWNMSCDSLAPFVSDRFELQRLSETEIRTLVRLLEDHDCLGPNLKDKTEDQRVHEFVKVAGRHLIVALHEATTGPPLADILEDEYLKIRPTKARQLYLTVCVLNRLRTPVRAGLISRVHDIPFEQFKEELFAPLDHVVEVRARSGTGDYYYQARHPEIAQIVFTRILSDKDDRLNEYLRVIENMNLAFDSDRESFRGLTRARALHELFSDYEDVRTIFLRAERVGSREAYLYQQRANYERIRPDGNFDDAEVFLTKARELDPRDESINHTLAEVYRSRAEAAGSVLTRQQYRDQARAILQDILASHSPDEYARVTIVKLEIDQLRDVLHERMQRIGRLTTLYERPTDNSRRPFNSIQMSNIC